MDQNVSISVNISVSLIWPFLLGEQESSWTAEQTVLCSPDTGLDILHRQPCFCVSKKETHGITSIDY